MKCFLHTLVSSCKFYELFPHKFATLNQKIQSFTLIYSSWLQHTSGSFLHISHFMSAGHCFFNVNVHWKSTIDHETIICWMKMRCVCVCMLYLIKCVCVCVRVIRSNRPCCACLLCRRFDFSYREMIKKMWNNQVLLYLTRAGAESKIAA